MPVVEGEKGRCRKQLAIGDCWSAIFQLLDFGVVRTGRPCLSQRAPVLPLN